MSTSATATTTASVDRLAISLRDATLEQIRRARGTEDGRHSLPASDSPRVGVDLVSVSDVAESVTRLGRRYLYRVFTPHERACARMSDALGSLSMSAGSVAHAVGFGDRSVAYSAESLAGRFAAKEAAVKVLRPRGARPEWRSIEVHRVAGGWCELRLSGLAAHLAAEAGIATLAVSVTHEPMMAAACVVAMSTGDATPWHQQSPSEQKGT